MVDNKIRSTSDKIVGSPSDRNRKVKSQESGENGSKSWIEKVRQYIGPASAALAMGGLAAQGILAINGVGGSTPEASGTALALRGSDYAMTPPAFPGQQRAEFIGKSPTEPYVPAPRPEWLSPPKGPTVQEIWPGLYEEMVKGLEEKGQASKNSLQEEAQETYNGETSSEQAKPDKNKSRKLLSSREEKIATMRVSIDKLKENPEPLQSLGKMLNEKQERERSLLESDSKIPAARTLLSDTNLRSAVAFSQELFLA